MEIEFTNSVVVSNFHKIRSCFERIAPGQEECFAKDMKIKWTEQTVKDRSQKIINGHFI
jgi:hypothetical protein